MLLLPGSLTSDRATLAALCTGLPSHSEVAHSLNTANLREYSGSWSDAERDASGDLQDAKALAHDVLKAGDSAVSVAIATPLHAALGLTDLTPADPSKLLLSADESRALCEAADAHMREDGVRLEFVDTHRWLVTCSQSVEVLTERPDWIIGELLRPTLPRGRDGRLVERWMNELQMLLHAHPTNIAREDRRLPTINLVWLWAWSPLHTRPHQYEGEGEEPGGVSDHRHSANTLEPTLSHQGRGGQSVEHGFANAIRNGDIAGWQATWQSVSPEILSTQTLILGDSRPRLRLTPTTLSITARLLSPFKRKATLAEALTQLQQSQ